MCGFEASDPEGDAITVTGWQFGDGGTSREKEPVYAFEKWNGPETERRYTVVLSVTDGHSTVSDRKTVTVKKQDRIRTFSIKGASFKMVRIPAGEFTMGSPPTEPQRGSDERQHPVRLSGYWIGETEVTQALWDAVMGSNPSNFKGCDDCPVESVSWDDAQAFIRKLNKAAGGKRFRLPTEAEWEYAARAGTTTAFAFGDCLSTDQANYNGNYPLTGCPKGRYRQNPTAVKSFTPNAWGLYDMHGNVWEWCQDWYGDYPSGSVTDPKGPSSGSSRVLRGGGWSNDAQYCRSAFRSRYTPGNRSYYLGFRLARTP